MFTQSAVTTVYIKRGEIIFVFFELPIYYLITSRLLLY